MKVSEIPFQQKNDFYSAYLNGAQHVREQFDYDPFQQDSYKQRWKEVQERSFPRESLHDHLLNYHQKLPASIHTINNINKLKDPESTVIVTGQQAGLLSGPLYTIHKCISAILLAKEQESKLGTPVIPVFWVAGEDHDFDEINHVYLNDEGRTFKKKLDLAEGNRSVSEIPFPKEKLSSWAEEVIRGLGETEHTQAIKNLIHKAIAESESITEFFAHIMLVLFAEEGIVMLDSNHPDLRKIESPFFLEMIQNNESLDRKFQKDVHLLKEKGFPVPVESETNNSHLFLNVHQNRVLLFRDSHEFKGKKNECLLTKSEMIAIAEDQPERLSNNVISRPFMQDRVLPTLAFVAGPGEIAYWGVLKSIFHQFDIKMPPVMPRLSLTLVESHISKVVSEKKMRLEEILQNGVKERKQEWLKNRIDWNLDEQFGSAKKKVDQTHRILREITTEIDKGLNSLAQKNGQFLQDQLDFLKNNLEHSIQKKYEHELKKFDLIELNLRPSGKPQERVFNIFYFLNQYGVNLVSELASLEFEFNGNHKVIHV
ncbi:bacillithiol biosynthesis cysteine-adding enzyme BshC [Alkalihalobacillus sp. AL-G]|uniref:bacillithiol biosynthesis cysteine-adding enzyme BshC n=1 Tax=Alkalihalobacillus sp. AL-G TaxID=2926399 RepID=UPI00272B1256|nr:bacillithiol biosynthesis cysteine-adding enzyme BshC [Alkalihalobacillus sp. AL-G]WLD95057.1 bacillithiol biosynthesis cysteine-adding enzyme BshC [Alkalihalobacillus sp. AL-G]